MISPLRFRLPVAIPRTKPVTAVDSFLHLLPGRRSVSSARSEMDAESYKFGPYKIDSSEVFRSTPLSYALVNLRPLVPGHILLQRSLCHLAIYIIEDI
ncbi:bifunctional bis(5'-adenosyl)-triphosphatase/adenylylsulfatase FHIT [Iris pallida]|uniref:Bifunctional bis(5'-adenosyl)-triphosphatase/adenylylsulfatase FHIT n=1 Tax=Iris pallida TaxID=29817 RepID=A0AAX6GTK4_IRIPA|nr:bifunctional bis(5'-adenosyl)-triphosphatase/adenylylsulfatase FHIT [Iris pallida]